MPRSLCAESGLLSFAACFACTSLALPLARTRTRAAPSVNYRSFPQVPRTNAAALAAFSRIARAHSISIRRIVLAFVIATGRISEKARERRWPIEHRLHSRLPADLTYCSLAGRPSEGGRSFAQAVIYLIHLPLQPE
jgi:hypothetical protein